MAGKLLNMKAVVFNKHCGKLKSKCFEFRHAPYTHRWGPFNENHIGLKIQLKQKHYFDFSLQIID
ncbi:MAG: hypothetical protein PWQ06_2291 [Anaerophaga sp.]|nr:hypothetical protein [Anaerophaga sp.]